MINIEVTKVEAQTYPATTRSETVITVQVASPVYIGGAGTGDMSSLMYDPTGVRDDCFDMENISGIFDAGTFN